MGIRGLNIFIEQNLNLLRDIELHDCNVLLDGNSIYHQMYRECTLSCLFGGEYDLFYNYCKQLFNSFQLCHINVIVVFDGARLNDKKLQTTLQRSKKRIDNSSSAHINIDLSPLLIRNTFINVIHDLNIPYISSLGEGDDECVTLANHLNAYVISRDSDYFVYNITQGYVPFYYLDITPIQRTENTYHLEAKLFTIDSLFKRFANLSHENLALACTLCGNDYISEETVKQIVDGATNIILKENRQKLKTMRTKHWYLLEWLKRYSTIDTALPHLLSYVKNDQRKNLESKLRLAFQSYIHPSDTLIYRFKHLQNDNLLKQKQFEILANNFFIKVGMDIEQIEDMISRNSILITKNGNKIPLNLIDLISNICLSPLFIEVLISRRIICAAHIELEYEQSIYVNSIPILLPVLAILLKWDDKNKLQTIEQQFENKLSLTSINDNNNNVLFYYRVRKQLQPCVYKPLEYVEQYNFEIPEFNCITELDIVKRERYVFNSIMHTYENAHLFYKRLNDFVHHDYHLWLTIVYHWYKTQTVKQVYVYSIILSFIKNTFLDNNKIEEQEEEMNNDECSLIKKSIKSLNSLIRTVLTTEKCQSIHSKLHRLTQKALNSKKFDISIIYEFNCLQTIYMFSLWVNEFFLQPYQTIIQPQQYLSCSFLYGFVEHYETKRSIKQAVDDLIQYEDILIRLVDELFNFIIS